ncbi:glycosyltransferase family 4 protein [Roseateles sp. P5_E7]
MTTALALPARQPTVARPSVRRIGVLHLIHTMAYGGVETAVLNWIRALDRERFDVHLACFANPGGTEQPFVDAAERLGIPVARLPWHRGKPVLRAARGLAALAAKRDISIVHAHNCYADVVTLAGSWLSGRAFRTITTAYVWFDYDHWKRNLIQSVDVWAMRHFDCVTAHCENTRLETLKRGFGEAEVRTLICGFETHRAELDAATRMQRRAELGAAEGQTVLINVARFYPEKAQVFLLECFARLLQQRPGLLLWLAGVGPLEAEIRAAAQRLQLGGSVRFLGFVPDLPPLLALADIQVHPAHIEGVPLAICEGLAAGLPIVASDVGGLPEILAGGRNGVLVPGLDVERFAAAVLSLVDDPERRQALGARGRHFIENDYSLRTAVAHVEATYDELSGPAP